MTEFTKDEKEFCYMLNNYLTKYGLGHRNIIDDIVECSTHLLEMLTDKKLI